MTSWKVDFIQELSKICSELRMRDHRAFIFWYIKATEDLPNEDVNERITDRSKDAGSDAVYPDYNTKTIKVIQSKYSPNIGESPFNKDELNKLNKVCDYILGKADYEELRDYIHKGLKERLDVAVRLVKEESFQVKPIFITTHRENPNYKIYDNSDIPIQVLSSKEIEIKYNEWLHGHTPELGELDFEYVELMHGPENPKAYLAILKTTVLREKYRKYKDTLFSRNVRIYQEKYKPNKAIKDTLTDKPHYFWYFNNGITILTERITPKDDERKLVLKNPQIINGCQSVTTIGESKESDALLFAKIVEIEDNISNQLLIDGIIEANNRQTPVDERMLKSNHPLQVKLQRELETLGYYYERKEGQYNEEKAKSKRIKEMYQVKNIDLIKSKIALVKEPHYAFSKEDDLFSNHFNDVFKDTNSCMDYLIPYLLWDWLQYFGGQYNRGKARKGFHKLVAWHLLRLIFDFNFIIKNNSRTTHNVKLLEDKEYMRENYPAIKKLIDVAYKVFEKSNYESGYAERDFLKNKDTYRKISNSVTRSLEREIQSLFA